MLLWSFELLGAAAALSIDRVLRLLTLRRIVRAGTHSCRRTADTAETQLPLPAQVGMQNSALGALLATLHFPDPLTPVYILS